jgi:branched-chain amino acid transport system permease protein
MLYLLMAVGFTLVFGTMRVVNFAHGEFYMLGAFVMYFAVVRAGLPFLVAIGVAFGSVAILGGVIERVVFHPFRGHELNGMIASIGVGLVMQNLALMAFGASPLAMPSYVSGVLRVGPLILPNSRLFAIGISLLTLVCFYGLIMHTRLGRALRAVVQDTEIAAVYGIQAGVIYPVGFALGVGLAGIAGAVMAPLFSVSPFIGETPLLKAFLVVVLGGIGSIPGAAVASLLVGLMESFGSTFMGATLADGLVLFVVIVVLVLRPRGLLGRNERLA